MRKRDLSYLPRRLGPLRPQTIWLDLAASPLSPRFGASQKLTVNRNDYIILSCHVSDHKNACAKCKRLAGARRESGNSIHFRSDHFYTMLGAVNRQNEENDNIVRAPVLRGLRANNRKTSGSIRVRNYFTRDLVECNSIKFNSTLKLLW